jgi:Fe-S-cluster containining protein
MPVFLECQRCTACCRWPGQVKVTNDEIMRMAGFKGMTEHDFIQAFTRLRADRQGLALMDKPNGECMFLDGQTCSVQPVKPQQCRDFPNLWDNPNASTSCQAIPRKVSEAQWRRLIRDTTGRVTNSHRSASSKDG